MKKPVSKERRAARLHAIAQGYVTEGLGKKNFEAIPYSENVVLRAPTAPGGSTNPLSGRETVRATWWASLPNLIEKVEVVDSYVNEALSAVTVEFYCTIADQKHTFRIMNRFAVSDDGEITSQENFFDPRHVTHPNWREE